MSYCGIEGRGNLLLIEDVLLSDGGVNMGMDCESGGYLGLLLYNNDELLLVLFLLLVWECFLDSCLLLYFGVNYAKSSNESMLSSFSSLLSLIFPLTYRSPTLNSESFLLF